MKAIILSLLAGTICYHVHAQPDATKLAQDNMKITAGGTFGKPKIVPSLDKLAIAQSSIYFKTATTREVLENERGLFGGRKSGGGSVAGRITAYLETTDGELTEADYQKMADEFYQYLSAKLTAAGVTTVDWQKVAATEFYQEEGKDIEDVRKDASAMRRKGQIYTMVNANKGSTLWKYDITGGPSLGFAMGKIKKASRFSDDVEAPVVFMHLTVDFADIFLDGDVKTSSSREETMFYTKVTKSKNFKMDAKVGADVKVSTNGASMFWNHKSQSEILNVTGDIHSDMPFASGVSQDETKEVLRKKDNLFAKDFNMTPMVVTTTKEKYMAAAKKALENYADAFVARVKLSKKD